MSVRRPLTHPLDRAITDLTRDLQRLQRSLDRCERRVRTLRRLRLLTRREESRGQEIAHARIEG